MRQPIQTIKTIVVMNHNATTGRKSLQVKHNNRYPSVSGLCRACADVNRWEV